jgi:DNA (cytosine-5)-methyltransferase 1
MNFYNDIDKNACAWLRELIAAGHLPPGDVDERSILEIKADELRGYDQCHFFAGVGFWSLALQWAGLGTTPGIWTGSCPCQPFSCAGARRGTADERHLWPVFRDLIVVCRPAVVFGEQVASAAVVGKVGRGAAKPAVPVWLDGVRADMAEAHYAFGAVIVPAAGVGSPNIRQRVYWVAEAIGWGCAARRSPTPGQTRRNVQPEQRGGACWPPNAGRAPGLPEHRDAPGERQDCESNDTAGVGARISTCRPSDAELRRSEQRDEGQRAVPELDADGAVGGIPVTPGGGQRADGGAPWQPGHAEQLQQAGGASDVQRARLEGHAGNGADRHEPGRHGAQPPGHAAEGVGAGDPWSDYRVHRYLDGKDRRIPAKRSVQSLVDDGPHELRRSVDACRDAGFTEDEIAQAFDGFPLSQGVEGRVMLLRGAGNAIIPALAAEFIEAWMDCQNIEKENQI